MKFEVVPNDLREEVRPARNVRSPWVQALLDGKTLKIAKADRQKLGGNSNTLKNHGFRLRTGAINDEEILVWAEKKVEE